MAMNGSFLGPFFALFLINANVCVLGNVQRHFSYHRNPLAWHAARDYCRRNYLDLALFTAKEELDSVELYQFKAWTGLFKDTSGAWKWSNGGNGQWPNWYQLLPNNDCAEISLPSKWFYTTTCTRSHFFYCSENGSGAKFIPLAISWQEAQAFCREENEDLITLTSGSTLLPVHEGHPVWTGLHRAQSGGNETTTVQAWEWSFGTSEFRPWAANQPASSGDCVSVSSKDRNMSAQDCLSPLPYVCMRDNLLLVKENKSWEQALEHCRAIELLDPHNPLGYNNHRYELLSLSSAVDQVHVWGRIQQATTDEVWTGLRYLSHEWLWVNGANVMYQDLPLCPAAGQRCGAVSRANATDWVTRDCREEKNFLCYRK